MAVEQAGLIVEISVALLVLDPALQPRTDGLDDGHIRALEEVVDTLPPLLVVLRGDQMVLVDGWHRLAALQNCGRDTVTVRRVTMPADGDLRRLAFEANAAHGRPLTLTDRRTEAARLLRLAPATSDREIARRCGLSQPTVAKVRADLEAGAQIEQTTARVGRGGYRYEIGDRPTVSSGAQGLERLFKSLASALQSEWWTSSQDVAALVAETYGHDDLAGIAEALADVATSLLEVSQVLGLGDL